MSETVIKLDNVRERVRSSEKLSDLYSVEDDLEYLVDEAALQLEFALEVANDSLFAVRALANRNFTTPTER